MAWSMLDGYGIVDVIIAIIGYYILKGSPNSQEVTRMHNIGVIDPWMHCVPQHLLDCVK
jgi:hypothetical protein